MPKRLLRGIIDFGSGLSQEALDANFRRLEKSPFKIDWTQPAYEKIYRFVSEFYAREGDVPTARVMADFFQRKDDIETIEALKVIKEATPSSDGGYNHFLREIIEEQRRLQLVSLVKRSIEVMRKGDVVEEGRQKTKIEPGVDSGVRYLEDHLDSLRLKPAQGRTRGDIRHETAAAWEDYEAAKNGAALGCTCEFEPIDRVTWGAQPRQIWTHIGFTGEMKSTLAINWCYFASTYGRRNVVYVSLEMTRQQIRNSIFALHSSHPKFGRSLNYTQIKRGKLVSEDEEFYQEVLDDFENNPEHCRFEIITPEEGGYGMPQLRTDLNRIHRDADIGLVVIDHMELFEPPIKNQNRGVEVNSSYLALRDMAKNYNDGEGLALLVLHQINRQGKERAAKNDGRYDLSAISWANEAERTSSIVTAGWRDDRLRSTNQVEIQCLKNRDDPAFEPVTLDIHWPSKRLSVSEERQRAIDSMTASEGGWDALDAAMGSV